MHCIRGVTARLFNCNANHSNYACEYTVTLCNGDSWNQRLAILAAMDKYNYAKSIDSEQAKDANSRLSKYRASMPDKNDGFMRGIKVGHAASVGCWTTLETH